MFLARHRDVEDEVAAAFLDGFGQGLAEANRRFADALDQALAGPNGYGIEGKSPTATEAIRRMLRGMAGLE